MTHALVTGAAARGGAAIARALHARGLDVVVHHGAPSTDAATKLVDELCAIRPRSALPWAQELSTEFSVPEKIRSLAVEVLVCNASTWKASSPDDFEAAGRDLNIHLMSHARIAAAFAGSLKSVVSVTDLHADRPMAGHFWYSISKAALQAWTLGLAVNWAPRTRANVVQPGTLAWPEDWPDESKAQDILSTIPLARVGSFEELAGTVTWLALDARYVTGTVLPLDGGRSRFLS